MAPAGGLALYTLSSADRPPVARHSGLRSATDLDILAQSASAKLTVMSCAEPVPDAALASSSFRRWTPIPHIPAGNRRGAGPASIVTWEKVCGVSHVHLEPLVDPPSARPRCSSEWSRSPSRAARGRPASAHRRRCDPTATRQGVEASAVLLHHHRSSCSMRCHPSCIPPLLLAPPLAARAPAAAARSFPPPAPNVRGPL